MSWHKSSSHSRGYGRQWRKLRELVMRRDGGICQCRHCKASGDITPATEVDHIIPKANGGTDDMDNLQAISHECHVRKTAEDEGKGYRQTTGLDGWPV